jgi:hypothetical protein
LKSVPEARRSRSLPRAVVAAAGAAVLCAVVPAPAAAHAFGVRYDLPLPMWMFLAGAGAAVALSFIGVSVLVRGVVDLEGRRLALLDRRTSALLAKVVEILSVLLYALLLATAFFGAEDTFRNFAPLFIWVIWWVGTAFISALLGDVWAIGNPLRVLFGWAFAGRTAGRYPYPEALGYWPAVLLFVAFAWCELISTLGEQPRALGWLVLGYSALTWLGMWLFGRDAWCRHGEVFTVVFGLFARFAPLTARDGRLVLRWPSVGLASDRALPLSKTVFVLAVLTTVTFDGILETPAWAGVLDWVSESRTLRPVLLALQDGGVDLLIAVKSVALVALVALFVVVFGAFMAWVDVTSGESKRLDAVMGWFVLSIVPIAIAYHLSHYFSYLMLAGQQALAAASDPFGWGWDLFGTADRQVDIGVVNAQMVWYVALAAIVLGHMFSVFIAHVTAFHAYATRRAALRSQYPMILLMVGYTMLSLWILSQPIVAQ